MQSQKKGHAEACPLTSHCSSLLIISEASGLLHRERRSRLDGQCARNPGEGDDVSAGARALGEQDSGDRISGAIHFDGCRKIGAIRTRRDGGDFSLAPVNLL